MAPATNRVATRVTMAAAQGFETRVQITAARYLAAQVLDARGRVFSTSSIISPA